LAAIHGRGGHAYFITDEKPFITFRQFLTDLLATQGIKAGENNLPRWIAWLLATVMEWLPLHGAPPITRAHLALIGGEVTVSDAKARQTLGYVGKVSREEGLKELSNHYTTPQHPPQTWSVSTR
jgi:hypothetical protein